MDGLRDLMRAAQAVHDAARSHKRAEDMHRRQARQLMAVYRDLEQVCEQAGVHITEASLKGESE